VEIQYINDGDATHPIPSGSDAYIVHCCNDVGAWGAGFVLALSQRWCVPEAAYRDWFRGTAHNLYGDFELGAAQCVPVAGDPSGYMTYVCNIIGQHGVGPDAHGNPPIRYDAIRDGLYWLREGLDEEKAEGRRSSVHCPMMGAGLAGGDWEIISSALQDILVDNGHPVTVYLRHPYEYREGKVCRIA
jgi:hypothetical protein